MSVPIDKILESLSTALAKASKLPWKTVKGKEGVFVQPNWDIEEYPLTGYVNVGVWNDRGYAHPDNCAFIVEAVNAIPVLLEERARLMKQIDDETCDACCSDPISEMPCMCNGSGRMAVAALYLRERMIDAETRADRLQAENQTLRERVTKYLDAFKHCADRYSVSVEDYAAMRDAIPEVDGKER